MGIIFTRDKKEKLINKLYNSFYEKENLLTNIKIDDLTCDSIIVTKKGIFLFKIFINNEELSKFSLKDDLWTIDHNISIENPVKELGIFKDKLINVLNDPSLSKFIYICPIFNKLDRDYEEIIFTLKGFKKYIDKLEFIFNNEEINHYTELIKNISKE